MTIWWEHLAKKLSIEDLGHLIPMMILVSLSRIMIIIVIGLGVLGMLVSLSNYIMGCCLHLFVESVCLHHSRNIELKHGTHPTLFPCQLMIVHDFSV